MKTTIIWHEHAYPANLIADYKVKIMTSEHGLIELDQCSVCGVWRSEDEDLYGPDSGPMCGGCCDPCGHCGEYSNPKEEFCSSCGRTFVKEE